MSDDTPSGGGGGALAGADPGAARGRRDAAGTRRLLISAARRRFARDGYQATTVRTVAADAGVNVALINRYFASKEGLFEACLPRTVDALEAGSTDGQSFSEVVQSIVTQVSRFPTDEDGLQLLLLLRSSGDEHADRIRRDTLRAIAERLADAAGWRDGDPATAHLLLRADVALATILGLVVLRSSLELEPLASAAAPDLSAPLNDAFTALLAPPAG